uniref:hypothetical protein n=1 Tax=Citrobacter freundii TaxID=546 RepID=UPI00129C7D52|nr:hypothetical protein [Citrobacter freundii]
MHRIDTPTAQKDKFGAGKNGFTRGNPQTGTPATDLDDDYFDMLQEELAGVVEASGVNLEKSKHNQLLTALKALLLSRAHPFADIKADGAEAIAEALSNLQLREAAKRNIGTGTSDISDNSYFTLSGNATSGVMHLPNNFKINWGAFSLSSVGSSTQVVTFYEAFTSGVIIVIPIPANVAGATNQIGYASVSRTQATIQKGSGDTAVRSGSYVALGI